MVLTTVGAKLSIDSDPVPFTLQTVVVLLAGFIGGANIGLTSQLVYLLFGMYLPVFAGNLYGPQIFSDITAGYLVAFPVAAFVCGTLGHKNSRLSVLIFTAIFAQTIIFSFGLTGMMLNSDMKFGESFRAGFLNLALWGYLKAITAALLYFFILHLSFKKE